MSVAEIVRCEVQWEPVVDWMSGFVEFDDGNGK